MVSASVSAENILPCPVFLNWASLAVHTSKKRIKVCEEYEKRGRIYDARAAAARALLDYYWEMNGDKPQEGGTVEEWEERIREFCRRWPKAMTQISAEDRKKLYQVTKEEATRKRLIHDGIRMPRPEAWLQRLGAI